MSDDLVKRLRAINRNYDLAAGIHADIRAAAARIAALEAENARLRGAGADVWDSVATLLRLGTPADAVAAIAEQNAAALRAKP